MNIERRQEGRETGHVPSNTESPKSTKPRVLLLIIGVILTIMGSVLLSSNLWALVRGKESGFIPGRVDLALTSQSALVTFSGLVLILEAFRKKTLARSSGGKVSVFPMSGISATSRSQVLMVGMLISGGLSALAGSTLLILSAQIEGLVWLAAPITLIGLVLIWLGLRS